ncbi:MAG TPA: beta-hydroxyacyl-ACP dehydratase [Bacteroidales bacterium]|nr:beta-hydroxyacyl-ACP dehydratase [Bacteroidales bacterium]
MLLGSFYTLVSFTCNPAGDGNLQCQATLRLEPSHPVYAGHFPGNPVVPGVCQIQIIRELAEKACNTRLVLTRSDTLKFLSMIVPQSSPELAVDLQVRSSEQNLFDISASIHSGGTTFLKFRGMFENNLPWHES